MSEAIFEEIQQFQASQGASATIDRLIENLQSRNEFHKLFEALMLKKKHELGISLAEPASFDDVPDEHQDEFKQAYVDAARRIGEMFLADNNITHAWVYFNTIGEPEKVSAAIELIDGEPESDGNSNEEIEDLIQIGLYEGANPVKGLELMLKTHGTCNTITAFDQQVQQISPDDRRRIARMLVREIYNDLMSSVRSEIEQKSDAPPPEGDSLRDLIAGRAWLFDEGNYHIDVSHLHSVVRFARYLEPADMELAKAVEMAEYGAQLAEQFQYPGDPPFEKFYPAHIEFLKALNDDNRAAAINYFREMLDAATDDQDRMMIAYVLVDLLERIDCVNEAFEVAEKYLQDVDEASGFSFSQLCRRAGRIDTLQQSARRRGDLVGYVAALLDDQQRPVTA